MKGIRRLPESLVLGGLAAALTAFWLGLLWFVFFSGWHFA